MHIFILALLSIMAFLTNDTIAMKLPEKPAEELKSVPNTMVSKWIANHAIPSLQDQCINVIKNDVVNHPIESLVNQLIEALFSDFPESALNLLIKRILTEPVIQNSPNFAMLCTCLSQRLAEKCLAIAKENNLLTDINTDKQKANFLFKLGRIQTHELKDTKENPARPIATLLNLVANLFLIILFMKINLSNNHLQFVGY